MITIQSLMESVADVWLVWILSAAALVYLTRGAILRLRRWNVRELAGGEEGASYTLSLVLVMPVYIFLVCLIVECTLMLVVKTGTMYAAYAAGRSAIVWVPAESQDADASQAKVKKAAVQAMTPFASGRDVHRRGTPLEFLPRSASIDGLLYYEAYQFYTKGNAPQDYIVGKYQFADIATQITIEPQGNEPNSELKVSVEYEMPINVPGIGRFLGNQASWPTAPFFTRKISSSVILEQEGPQSSNQLLGIEYDSSI